MKKTVSKPKDCVRIGIVGVGNMGSFHANSILGGAIPRAKLTAVCDINPAKLGNITADDFN